MAKKNKGKNATKGGRQSKYKKRFAEHIYWIVECGLVNTRGQIGWRKVAKMWGVSESLIRRWLNRLDSDYYKAELAEQVKKAQAAIDLGKVKRDSITAAGRHVRHKRIREVVVRGPKPPKSSYTKALLIRYAADVLKPPLKLDAKRTKRELLYEIERAIEAQTTQKMELVRTESQEVYGDPAARKLVVANVGPEEERWTDKEGRVHEASDGLAGVLERLKGQDRRLPHEEFGDITGDDRKGIGQETGESILETEQSIHDNE